MKALLIVLSIIVFIGLCVGGWFLYWAVALQNQNQQYGVNTHSQQYQSSLISQERDAAQGWTNATDPAQKKQIAETFCAVYSDLTEKPIDLVQADARMCN